MRIFLLVPFVIIIIVWKFLSTDPKSEWEKYLEKELEDDPDYIDWLKIANCGKDYKLGLKILKRLKKEKKSSYNRWFKRIRKLGKY